MLNGDLTMPTDDLEARARGIDAHVGANTKWCVERKQLSDEPEHFDLEIADAYEDDPPLAVVPHWAFGQELTARLIEHIPDMLNLIRRMSVIDVTEDFRVTLHVAEMAKRLLETLKRPSCADCMSASVDTCPACGKHVCGRCAEAEGKFCCDGESP